MKKKDSTVKKLTNFTLYLVFLVIAALLASAVVMIILWMWGHILGRC